MRALLLYDKPYRFLCAFTAGFASVPRSRGASTVIESTRMTDLSMLALGAGFFVIALAYVYACDSL
jgi:hypothetical protein